jgi:hypothetical protein
MKKTFEVGDIIYLHSHLDENNDHLKDHFHIAFIGKISKIEKNVKWTVNDWTPKVVIIPRIHTAILTDGTIVDDWSHPFISLEEYLKQIESDFSILFDLKFQIEEGIKAIPVLFPAGDFKVKEGDEDIKVDTKTGKHWK